MKYTAIQQAPCHMRKTTTMKLTEQMIFALIGVHIKNLASKISEADDRITLRRIHREFAVFENLGSQILLNTMILHKLFEIAATSAFCIITKLDPRQKSQYTFFKLLECPSVHNFPFSRFRNERPA